MMPTYAVLTDVRLTVGGQLVGSLCKHCNRQLIGGESFCNYSHFFAWYREQRKRRKQRPWW